MSFSIDLPLKDLIDDVSDVARKQIPFATALALTWTAKEAQENLRAALPERFTIRNTYLASGIRVRAATKRRPFSEVFTLDEILRLQIEGGTKHPRRSAIPLPRAIRGNAKGIFRKAKRPAALRDRPRHFVAPVRRGDRGLFKRTSKKRYPIVFLWRLWDRSVRIDSRFDFVAIVQDTAARRFDKLFGKALAKAIRTAR